MKTSLRSYLLTGLLGTLCLFSTWANAAQQAANYQAAARYDISGRLVGTLGPDPDGAGPLGFPATRNTYDVTTGLLQKVERGSLSAWQTEDVAPANWTGFSAISTETYAYDTLGRKVSIRTYGISLTTPASFVQLTYDDYNRVTCEATRMDPSTYSRLPDGASACMQTSKYLASTPVGPYGYDRIKRYTYSSDDFGNITKEERGVDTPLQETYKTATYVPGKTLLESESDANGNKTSYTYDAPSGWLLRANFPSATLGSSNASDYVEFTYDNNGNKKTERKRNGALINYTVDNLNRVIVKDYVDNTKQRDIYYDYDLRGLQILEAFGTAANADRTAQKYDGFGNITTDYIAMNGVGRGAYSRYDLNNNRIKVSHSDGAYFTYGYDYLDRFNVLFEGSGTRILDMVYGNDGRRKNINRRSNLSTTQYSFTDGLHLDSFTQDFAGTANDVTNTFQYNPANQITRFAVANGNTQYMYRGDNNRTGAYQPNHLNQYTKVNGQPLGYDANQNLTNDGTQTYQYDDENRLISTSGAVTASFVYDPRGRLFQSTINGVVAQYLYDGDKLIAEYDGTGTLTRRYVHGNGVDEPLLQYNSATLGTAAWRYLHTDQQGSVIAQSDVNGNVISGTVMAYDTFGITSNPSASRFAYTGQIQFPELGVYYYKARFYSPKLGRFLQTDPIGYKDDLDLYSYVGNDPINKTDPTGTSLLEIGFLIADVAELSSAISSGEGIGMAVANVAIDAVGVASPVPGISEASHAIQAASKVEKVLTKVEKTASGKRVEDFTRAQKNEAKAANAERNGGKMKCEGCGKEVQNVKSEKGVPTPDNQAQVHHEPPISEGGTRETSKPEVLCPQCHRDRHD